MNRDDGASDTDNGADFLFRLADAVPQMLLHNLKQCCNHRASITPAPGVKTTILLEIMGDVILRDFDGNTLSSQLLNWIGLQRSSNLVYPSRLLAVRGN